MAAPFAFDALAFDALAFDALAFGLAGSVCLPSGFLPTSALLDEPTATLGDMVAVLGGAFMSNMLITRLRNSSLSLSFMPNAGASVIPPSRTFQNASRTFSSLSGFIYLFYDHILYVYDKIIQIHHDVVKYILKLVKQVLWRHDPLQWGVCCMKRTSVRTTKPIHRMPGSVSKLGEVAAWHGRPKEPSCLFDVDDGAGQ